MFFILTTLLLRKIKGDGKLLSILRTIFRIGNLIGLNQWIEVVEGLADIVHVQGRTADFTPPNPKSVQELQAFNVRRGIELISKVR